MLDHMNGLIVSKSGTRMGKWTPPTPDPYHSYMPDNLAHDSKDHSHLYNGRQTRSGRSLPFQKPPNRLQRPARIRSRHAPRLEL